MKMKSSWEVGASVRDVDCEGESGAEKELGRCFPLINHGLQSGPRMTHLLIPIHTHTQLKENF